MMPTATASGRTVSSSLVWKSVSAQTISLEKNDYAMFAADIEASV